MDPLDKLMAARPWYVKAWTWLKVHSWAAWVTLGALVIVLVRVVFHRVTASDAMDQERARLDWERQAQREDLQRAGLDVRRAELLREASAKAKARLDLEGRSTALSRETASELERIQTLDAEQLAAEWEELRRSEAETPAIGRARK